MGSFDPNNPGQVTASERQSGAEAHPQILAEFGGAYTGPGSQMVDRVGKEVAVESGLSQTGSDCTVTFLNSSVVNAFAIPGCYVYVTRGLVALMENEAQLASVLGHEIGHVAADHGQRRQNAALGSSLLSVLAGVLTGSGQVAQLAGQLGQVWTLKYSRDQEYQSDDLGILYMRRAGYDPYESADVLEALGDQAALEAQIRGRDEAAQIPAWARTHPLSADRVQRATAQARETGVQPGQLAQNESRFYSAIDGMLYGDAPEQGFVDKHQFAHPTLRLAFRVPDGFYLNNSSSAVTATSGNSPVQIQFSGGSKQAGESIASVTQQALRGLLGNSAQQAQYSQVETTTINGMPAAQQQARVASNQGQVDLTVIAYEYDADSAYYFAFISPANVSAANVISTTAQSFRKLSASEAAQLEPKHLEVVTVGSGDTVASLSRRMAFDDYQEARFRVLNDLEDGGEVSAGDRVKIVVEG
ncbi:M48 family metalloprotease [Pacificimonas aurantium]|nr:M48 family metalloprotease [Pacificimonas aurantium]